MRKRILVAGIAASLAVGAALPSSVGAAASDKASCVGQGASDAEPGREKGEFVSGNAGPGFGQFVSNTARCPR